MKVNSVKTEYFMGLITKNRNIISRKNIIFHIILVLVWNRSKLIFTTSKWASKDLKFQKSDWFSKLLQSEIKNLLDWRRHKLSPHFWNASKYSKYCLVWRLSVYIFIFFQILPKTLQHLKTKCLGLGHLSFSTFIFKIQL